MVLAAVIVGGSLIVSAAILFAGLTNQRTVVVYSPATSQELMVELLKVTAKEVGELTKKVKNIPANAPDPTKNDADGGQGPGENSLG